MLSVYFLLKIPGSPVIVNGDEFQNIEIVHNNVNKQDNIYVSNNTQSSEQGADMNRNFPTTQKCDIIVTGSMEEKGTIQHPLMSPNRDQDAMLEFVKNKGLMKATKLDQRVSSIDSEMSEASTLVSTSSEKYGGPAADKRRSRINHHSIRGFVSDSEMESIGVCKMHSDDPFFVCLILVLSYTCDWYPNLVSRRLTTILSNTKLFPFIARLRKKPFGKIVEKGEMLVKIIFSYSYNVFSPIIAKFHHFGHIRIVVCKVMFILVWLSLLVVW